LIEINENPTILIDTFSQSIQCGEYTGSIIVKLNRSPIPIIFADNLTISDEHFYIKGLHIGFKNGRVISTEKETELWGDLSLIDFCVKIPQEIVKEFDASRLSGIYPNIVRFLHTAPLFLNTRKARIDHLDFVVGEILNRPIAVGKRVLIVGDRLVIDEMLQPIFYDCIMIQRQDDNEVETSYEPFINVPLSTLEYIILLGAENF
jgi:hypothetical protein